MCTDQASGLNIVPRRHGYDLINERMPPAVSAEHCGNQNKRKSSSNPSAAWVIMIVWVPLRLAAFCLSPIRTIIGRVMFTASPVRRARPLIFGWTGPPH
jgi:hypothetical protein